MKIWNVIFNGQQPFQAAQIVVADDEASAREGIKLLLGDKVPGFEIHEVKDITKPEEPDEASPVLN